MLSTNIAILEGKEQKLLWGTHSNPTTCIKEKTHHNEINLSFQTRKKANKLEILFCLKNKKKTNMNMPTKLYRLFHLYLYLPSNTLASSTSKSPSPSASYIPSLPRSAKTGRKAS